MSGTTASELQGAIKGMAMGMVKGNTADTLGAPVDLVNTAIKPITERLGIATETPFGGSAHFRTLFGMDVEDKNLAETAGSMISIGGAAKAMIVGAGRMEKLSAVDLTKAQEMFTKHPEVNPASVYNATGVYKGEDGGLRAVISDKDARLKTENMKNDLGFLSIKGQDTPLGDILDHPKLYQMYPEAAKIPVNPENRQGVQGSFGDLGMTVQSTRKGMENNTVSVLLHELQHFVQKQEGWTRGGNPNQFLPKDINNTAKSVQSAVTSGKQSPDPAVRDAAERFKERFNNKVKDAHTKYENIPGEQEARFTETTKDYTQEQLAANVRNQLRAGVTPQSWDTQKLPSQIPKGADPAAPAAIQEATVLERIKNMLTAPK